MFTTRYFRGRRSLLFLPILFLATTSCEATTHPDLRAFGEIELHELPAGSIADPWVSGLDSVRAIIRSADQWNSLWSPDPPVYPMPSVDLDKYMVLVAASGPRGGHGWRIEISQAWSREDAGDTVYVSVREFVSCGTTGMTVTPFDAVAIAKRPTPVRFLDGGTWREDCS